jgi:hypothetical protein
MELLGEASLVNSINCWKRIHSRQLSSHFNTTLLLLVHLRLGTGTYQRFWAICLESRITTIHPVPSIRCFINLKSIASSPQTTTSLRSQAALSSTCNISNSSHTCLPSVRFKGYLGAQPLPCSKAPDSSRISLALMGRSDAGYRIAYFRTPFRRRRTSSVVHKMLRFPRHRITMLEQRQENTRDLNLTMETSISVLQKIRSNMQSRQTSLSLEV